MEHYRVHDYLSRWGDRISFHAELESTSDYDLLVVGFGKSRSRHGVS